MSRPLLVLPPALLTVLFLASTPAAAANGYSRPIRAGCGAITT